MSSEVVPGFMLLDRSATIGGAEMNHVVFKVGGLFGAIACFAAASAVGGCAASHDDHPDVDSPSGASTEISAVVVDYYAKSAATEACSGTLLSSQVVVTAAHCADKS